MLRRNAAIEMAPLWRRPLWRWIHRLGRRKSPSEGDEAQERAERFSDLRSGWSGVGRVLLSMSGRRPIPAFGPMANEASVVLPGGLKPPSFRFRKGHTMAGLKQVFRTQLWEHREPRFLRLLVKAGTIQEKDEANSIELYERVIEMEERVADA